MDGVKKCSECGEIKGVGEFSKDKSKKDGYQRVCKMCMAVYQIKYREKNKDKAREADRKYYEENKDKAREADRKYREKNKDKLREAGRKYREKNKDKIKLSDGYFKKLIVANTALSPKDIPYGLVELKRAEILLVRELQAQSAI